MDLCVKDITPSRARRSGSRADKASENSAQDYAENFSAALDQPALENRMLQRRLAQGDAAAFWGLWEQYRTTLFYQCLAWLGGNHADARYLRLPRICSLPTTFAPADINHRSRRGPRSFLAGFLPLAADR